MSDEIIEHISIAPEMVPSQDWDNVQDDGYFLPLAPLVEVLEESVFFEEINDPPTLLTTQYFSGMSDVYPRERPFLHDEPLPNPSDYIRIGKKRFRQMFDEFAMCLDVYENSLVAVGKTCYYSAELYDNALVLDCMFYVPLHVLRNDGFRFIDGVRHQMVGTYVAGMYWNLVVRDYSNITYNIVGAVRPEAGCNVRREKTDKKCKNVKIQKRVEEILSEDIVGGWPVYAHETEHPDDERIRKYVEDLKKRNPTLRPESGDEGVKLLDKFLVMFDALPRPADFGSALDRIQAVVFTAISIYTNPTIVGQMSAVMAYAASCGYTTAAVSAIRRLVHRLYGIKDDRSDDEEEVRPEAGSFTARDLLSSARGWKKHPFARNLHTLITLVVTMGLVAPRSFSLKKYKIYEAQSFDTNQDAADIIDLVWSSISYFVNVGHKCFVEKSFAPVLETLDAMSTMETKLNHLFVHKQDLIQGNYFNKTSRTPDDYKDDMNECFDLYLKIKLETDNKLQLQTLNVLYSKLNSCRDAFIQWYTSNGFRIAPFSFLLHGGSSVGKSCITKTFATSLLAENGFPHTDRNFASVDPDSKHLDTVTGESTVYIMDDIANIAISHMKGNFADLIIKINNNVTQAAPKAEAQDKGKIMIIPKLFVGSTNVKGLEARSLSNCPESILRRFNYHIGVKVKPLWAKGCKLDDDKVFRYFPGHPLPDVWDMTVEYVDLVPAGEGRSRPEYRIAVTSEGDIPGVPANTPLKDVSVKWVLSFLHARSKEHFLKQEALKRGMDNIPGMTARCECCGKANIVCYCVPATEDDGDECKEELSPVWEENVAAGIRPEAGLIEDYVVQPIANYLVKKLQDSAYCWTQQFKTLFTEPWLDRQYREVKSTVDLLTFRYQVRPWFGTFLLDCLPDVVVQSREYELVHYHVVRRLLYPMGRYARIIGTLGIGYWLYPNYRECWRELVGAFFWWNCVVTGYIHSTIEKDLRQRRDLSKATRLLANGTGDRTLDILHHTAISLTACGMIYVIISVVRKMYAMYSEKTLTPESALDPSVEEIDDRDKSKCVWTKPSTPVIHKNATARIDHVANRVKSNIMNIQYLEQRYEDGEVGYRQFYSSCVFVSSCYLMMPYHMWFEDIDTTRKRIKTIKVRIKRAPTITASGKQATGTFFEATLERSCMKRISDTDACIVYFPRAGTFRNIVPDFVEEVTLQEVQARAIYRTLEGEVQDYPVQLLEVGKPIPRYAGMSNFACFRDYRKEGEWQLGECGTTYVTDYPSPSIMGFHVAGVKSNKGYGVLLTRQMVEQAIEALQAEHPSVVPVAEAGTVDLELCGVEIPYVESVDNNSPVQWLNEELEVPFLDVYGSIGSCSSYYTEVQDSILAPHLEKYYGPNKFAGPNFRPEGKSWRPWYDSLVHMANPRESLPVDMMDTAMVDYMQPLLSKIEEHKSDFDWLRPLTRAEILAGIDGKKFIDRMELNSSAGFPYTGKKRNMMELLPSTSTHASPLEWKDPTIWDISDKYEQIYMSGARAHHVFKACLKDEPTPIGKDKVRVFEAAPLHLQLIMRKYFLPLIRVISLYPLLSECAVGINCYSMEWQEVHDHLCTFGPDRIMAGDYSKWDLRLPPQLMLCAFEVLLHMARASGRYTYKDLCVMRGVIADTVYPLVHFNGTLIGLFGGNPSGQNLTAHINSICNSLLLRVVFFTHNRRAFSFVRPLYFRDCVKAITYGDDLAAGVSSKCKFNNILYQQELEKHGVVYTMPDKHSAMVSFMDIASVEFLKRTSRKVEGIDTYCGALQVNSILRSLYCFQGSSQGQYTVMSQCVRSALNEAFFWGPSFYETFRLNLTDACDHVGLLVVELALPYEELVERWKKKYLPRGESPMREPTEMYNVVPAAVPLGSEHTRVVSGVHSDLSHSMGLDCEDINWPTITEFRDATPGLNGDSVFDEEHIKGDGVTGDLRAETGIIAVQMSQNGEERVVKFSEGISENVTSIVDGRDSTFYDINTTDAELASFLARPCLTRTFEWDINGDLGTRFCASRDFLSNKRVVNKINNFAYITGTFHVKAIMTGTPFHYGKAIMSLNLWPKPMQYYDANSAGVDIYQMSQLPHICLDPNSAQGGTLTYPLIHPWNALDLVSFEHEFDIIELRSINNLKALNDAKGVTIRIYVWMTDVKLSVPTAANSAILQAQAGENDEYGDTIAQKVSTIAATAQDMLHGEHLVSKMARASLEVVKQGANVAAMFGYSRPSGDIADNFMQHKNVGNLSNYNARDSSVKLSLDAKQEVTIDPRAVGVSGVDEMDLRSIATRESYLRSFEWSTDDAVGDLKWRCVVSPVTVPTSERAVVEPDLYPQYTLTPLAFAALPFRYWRGGIKIRVEVVGTSFHKGKLKIIFDPRREQDTLAWRESNINQTYILDLNETKEYTMCVAYATNRPFLFVPRLDRRTQTVIATNDLVYTPNSAVGLLAILVESPLTVSSTAGALETSIYVNTYISACDDIEFADPDFVGLDPYTLSLPYVIDPGAGEIRPEAGDLLSTPGDGMSPGHMQTDLYSLTGIGEKPDSGMYCGVHFGERISSARQLCKRYSQVKQKVRTITEETYDNLPVVWKQFASDFPEFPFNPTELVVPGPEADVKFNPLTYFSSAFLCRRGGIRWKYIALTRTPPDKGFIDQLIGARTSVESPESIVFRDTPVDGNDPISTCYNGWAGAAAVNIPLNNCLEIELPYATQNRFFFAQNLDTPNAIFTKSVVYQQTNHVIGYTSMIDTGSVVRLRLARLVAGADDFSLSVFKCAPRLISRSAVLQE